MHLYDLCDEWKRHCRAVNNYSLEDAQCSRSADECISEADVAMRVGRFYSVFQSCYDGHKYCWILLSKTLSCFLFCVSDLPLCYIAFVAAKRSWTHYVLNASLIWNPYCSTILINDLCVHHCYVGSAVSASMPWISYAAFHHLAYFALCLMQLQMDVGKMSTGKIVQTHKKIILCICRYYVKSYCGRIVLGKNVFTVSQRWRRSLVCRIR